MLSPHCKEWEHFDIVDMHNGRIGLKNIDGHFIGGRNQVNQEPVFAPHCKEWEWFELVPA